MTLTAAAQFFKRGLLIFLILIFLGTASFIGYKIWHANYLASLPPVEEKPDIKYGNLPYPPLPSPKSELNLSYSIDTNTGGFPDFGKIVKVYFVPKAVATILATERTSEFARKMGFTSVPIIISETKYNYQEAGRNLTVNLDTGNFSYQASASALIKDKLPNDQTLADGFKRVLSSLGSMKQELNAGPSKVQIFKNTGNLLVGTEIRAEAEAAQISLFPENIDDKPILTTSFRTSLVNATVYYSSENIANYASINFTFWPIDKNEYGTYPLRKISEAFEDLKSGQGAIIIKPAGFQVSITNAYLAYLQSEEYNQYLQPVYVFEGPGFVGFTPAIDKSVITN